MRVEFVPVETSLTWASFASASSSSQRRESISRSPSSVIAMNLFLSVTCLPLYGVCSFGCCVLAVCARTRRGRAHRAGSVRFSRARNQPRIIQSEPFGNPGSGEQTKLTNPKPHPGGLVTNDKLCALVPWSPERKPHTLLWVVVLVLDGATQWLRLS